MRGSFPELAITVIDASNLAAVSAVTKVPMLVAGAGYYDDEEREPW